MADTVEFTVTIGISRRKPRAGLYQLKRPCELVLEGDHSYVREFLIQQLGLAFADALVEIATRDFE